ncbi:MAG: NAD-dependent succinate-semialdehyde dehydrogenase [bacterium]|nr:NAD-dependent succinate-semialdehyde dehydrogenase [bacterium]
MRYQMWINGEWRDAINGGTWDVINPATEEKVAAVPFGDVDDARAAIDAAYAAQPKWAAMTAYERGAILRRVADLIVSKLDELAPITTRECGKVLAETRAEWNTTAAIFDWFAEEGKRAYGRTIPGRTPGKRLQVVYHPVGVVATITAWNFPAFLLARYWAAALAAGCTVVGRPSELTPMSAMALANVLEEAGMPPGVVNVINGDAAGMGQEFLDNLRVDKVSFTGSQRVGRLLMQGAAGNLRRLSLELGGSAPVLIFDDVDVEAAAQKAVAAKFRNNGQVCVSPTRFYVQQSIYEDFMEASRTFVEKLVLGDGMQPGVTTGPLVTLAGREKVELFVQDAVAQGAAVVTGGERPSQFAHGYFYRPTILTQVTDSMKIICDEVFGPVMPISAFKTLEEGVEMANSTPYGLAGYLMAKDMTTAIRAYEGMKFGVIGVNDLLPTVPEAPFGGMKQSGFGRELGSEGMHEYLEPKFVSIAL